MTGKIWRLTLPGQAVRGAYVSLGPQWAELVRARGYGADAAALLGQTLAAMPMLLMQLKSQAKLSLQMTQAQPVSLLVAQGSTSGQVRGMIKLSAEQFDVAMLQGQLAVTLEPEGSKQNYQGIVPLEGQGMNQWLAQYFQQSEQLTTRLILCADQDQANGILLQSLPGDGQGEGDGDDGEGEAADFDWVAAMEAMDVDVLPNEPGEWLSTMLGCDLEVSEQPQAVELACPCSEQTVSNMLLGLGREELESILEEQGVVNVACGFCGQDYPFDAGAVQTLLASDSSRVTLH